jgi:hypothetical protein
MYCLYGYYRTAVCVTQVVFIALSGVYIVMLIQRITNKLTRLQELPQR